MEKPFSDTVVSLKDDLDPHLKTTTIVDRAFQQQLTSDKR